MKPQWKPAKFVVAVSVTCLVGLASEPTLAAKKAPFEVAGYTYDMVGTFKAGGKARCGGFAGGGGAKSKFKPEASISFNEDGSFSWFDDTMSPYGQISDGQIINTSKNGKKLTLAFGMDHATALLSIAGLNNTGNINGVDIGATHSMKATVSDKKLTVTEKAVLKYQIMHCTYKYTITRKMKGTPQVSS